MFVTFGVHLNRYCLPDKYWNDEFYSDYSVLLLLAGQFYLNLVVCSFRNMPDADVQLKQTVAIFPVLAFHFLCVFRFMIRQGLLLVSIPTHLMHSA